MKKSPQMAFNRCNMLINPPEEWQGEVEKIKAENRTSTE